MFNTIVIAIFIAVGILLFSKFTSLSAQSSDYEFDTQFVLPKVNLTKYDPNTVNITMSRGMCFGTCPVYYLEIHGDGKVIYRGFKFVNITGERTSYIPSEEVKDLIKWFNDNNYFNFKDRSDQISFTDASSIETSISIGGLYKSVYHYLGTFGVPEVQKLKELGYKIDNITNSSQWIGNGTYRFD